MNRTSSLLKSAVLIVAAFALGCISALALRAYDAGHERITPITGGQTIDFSEYGFHLTVPDGYSLVDYTTNNRAEGGNAVFAGCAFDESGNELYIFCYDNETGDAVEDYGEQELVSYYTHAGADDVRLRTLGGRRFVCYSAVVEAQDGAQTWFTYETWDAAHQVTFETRMSDAAVLPILATIDFDI